jgi:hypothetical protein
MTTLVLGNDFEAHAKREPQQWNEGVLVPNAVRRRSCLPASPMLGQPRTPKKDDRFHLPGGFYLLRRPGTCSARIWSNVRANEPSVEPAEGYLFDWSARPAFRAAESSCTMISFSGPEVLEALADTPKRPVWAASSVGKGSVLLQQIRHAGQRHPIQSECATTTWANRNHLL